MPTPTNVKFFKTSMDLRKWFEKNHEKLQEQWIGYYKKDSGKPSITWQESVDQALCFGWIDGIRKSIDEKSYTIRFTPRKLTSIWSAININRVTELKKLGLMKKSGLDIFENRDVKKSNLYSFEQRKNPKLSTAQIKKFKANKKAWAFFSSQAPWYQRTSTWWVISAKQEATQLKRLAQLMKDCEHEQTIMVLTRKK
jgi:uncharacterized protein YdeI (YjbR/CyaY-like superfamily)